MSKKSFKLNKCFSLTAKNLFSCTAPQSNYDYMSYDAQSNMDFSASINPTSSTRIESEAFGTQLSSFEDTALDASLMRDSSCHDYSQVPSCGDSLSTSTSSSAEYNSSNRSFISSIAPVEDNTILCENEEAEMSRRTNYSAGDYESLIRSPDFPDVTILKQNSSPISDLRSLHPDVDSLASSSSASACTSCDYLQSTKLSTATSKCIQCVGNFSTSSAFDSICQPACYNTIESSYASSSPSLISTIHQYEDDTIQSSADMQNSHYSIEEYQNMNEQISKYEACIDKLERTFESTKDEDTVVHVCTSNYDATFVDDISVQFADTVRILSDANDEWLYVQVSGDERKGYVPRTIVFDLKQFLEQLKQHHHSLVLSKQSFFEQPTFV